MKSGLRCFMKSSKGDTRAINVSGETVEEVVHYVTHYRADLEEALGVKLKDKSPVLVEIIGGKY